MTAKASQIAQLLGHAATLCAALVAVALPWEGFQQIPGAPVTVVKVAGAALIAVAALHFALYGRGARPRTGLEGPIALFAAACVVSAVVSVDTAASIAHIRTYVTYLLFFYALVHALRDAAEARILIGLYSASACATAAVTLAASIGWLRPALWGTASWPTQRLILEYRDGLPMRMSGVAGDFNLAALDLVAAFACVLFAFRGQAVLRAVAAAVLLGALAVTMSRSGALVAAALAVCWLFIHLPPRRRVAAGIVGGAALIIALVAMSLTPYGETLLDRATGGILRDDGSLKGRFQVYGLALSLLPQYALLGCGIGASDAAMKGSAMADQAVMTLHSTPFKLLLETGVVGFGALLWLGAAAYRRTVSGLVRSGEDTERRVGRAFLAAAGAAVAMVFVQPFPLLALYPFLLATAFGPIASLRRDAAFRAQAPVQSGAAHGLLAAVVVAAVAGLNFFVYQVTAADMIQFSDALADGRRAEIAGEWSEAERHYRGARTLAWADNLDARPYGRLAEALVSMPTLQAELALPGTLLPASDAADLAYGRLMLMRGDLDEARDAFARVQTASARDWLAFSVAEALWRAQRYGEALDAYAAWAVLPAEARRPEDAALAAEVEAMAAEGAGLDRAASLRRLGRWDEAVALYAMIGPDSPEAVYNAGVAAELSGDGAGAADRYQAAASMGHVPAARRLAVMAPPEPARSP